MFLSSCRFQKWSMCRRRTLTTTGRRLFLSPRMAKQGDGPHSLGDHRSDSIILDCSDTQVSIANQTLDA